MASHRALPLLFPTVMVWGANTGVGKTLVSAGLAAAALKRGGGNGGLPAMVNYLKPLQTGFPRDCDSSFVVAACRHLLEQATSAHTPANSHGSKPQAPPLPPPLLHCHTVGSLSDTARSRLPPEPKETESLGGFMDSLKRGVVDRDREEQRLAKAAAAHPNHFLFASTHWAWAEPVSPHLVAGREGGGVPCRDEVIIQELTRSLILFSAHVATCEKVWKVLKGGCREGVKALHLVEQAGGVASPGPMGTLQCDLYRPLRLPALLVGDGRLGGISATISAYETLATRGYDVAAVALCSDRGQLGNEDFLRKYLDESVPVISLPPLPPGDEGGEQKLPTKWFNDAAPALDKLLAVLEAGHEARVGALQGLGERAKRQLWWPFTQHGLAGAAEMQAGGKGGVTVIDSRSGEDFLVFEPGGAPISEGPALVPKFDACASWWTQGVGMQHQAAMAQAVARAAGRYGHVMFPENAHAPAVELAERLLGGVGKGWASRVFYSDNGSTAVEVALKMAFRKFVRDHGIAAPGDHSEGATRDGHERPELLVLALAGSYHGDTLGAMEAQGPTAFTGFLQQPWYTGRGVFLRHPSVFLREGSWEVQLPEDMAPSPSPTASTSTQAPADKPPTSVPVPPSAGTPHSTTTSPQFGQLDEVFDLARDQSALADRYRAYIRRQLEDGGGGGGLRKNQHLGALVIEPVLHGAGGMVMVDPLFQRLLVAECRARKIPVVFDEVFAGLWRLGRQSAAELLGCQPDIATYAKLLTGGVVPLAVTLASEGVFESFLSDSKLDALLHGHSYTAHAIGCSAGLTALQLLSNRNTNPNLIPMHQHLEHLPGQQAQQSSESTGALSTRRRVKSPKINREDPMASRTTTGEKKPGVEVTYQLQPLWPSELVFKISFFPNVSKVIAIGTVFAVEIDTSSNKAGGGKSGYASTATQSIIQRLRSKGVYARPLGSVIYLMVTPFTSPSECARVLATLASELLDEAEVSLESEEEEEEEEEKEARPRTTVM